MSGVVMRALHSNTDDITQISTPMSIQLGDKIDDCEKIKLQVSEILKLDRIRHLGNYLQTSLNNNIDNFLLWLY